MPSATGGPSENAEYSKARIGAAGVKGQGIGPMKWVKGLAVGRPRPHVMANFTEMRWE
ncbi:MAG: hypothetical protein ABW039_02430 [Sphingobium sp.]